MFSEENGHRVQNDAGNSSHFYTQNDASGNIVENIYYERDENQNNTMLNQSFSEYVINDANQRASVQEQFIDVEGHLVNLETHSMEIINTSENPYYTSADIRDNANQNENSVSLKEEIENDTMTSRHSDENDYIEDINTDTFQRVSILENPYYGGITNIQGNVEHNEYIAKPIFENYGDNSTATKSSFEDGDVIIDGDCVAFQRLNTVETPSNDQTTDISNSNPRQNITQVNNTTDNIRESRPQSCIYQLSDGVVLNLEAGEVQISSNTINEDTMEGA